MTEKKKSGSSGRIAAVFSILFGLILAVIGAILAIGGVMAAYAQASSHCPRREPHQQAGDGGDWR